MAESEIKKGKDWEPCTQPEREVGAGGDNLDKYNISVLVLHWIDKLQDFKRDGKEFEQFSWPNKIWFPKEVLFVCQHSIETEVARFISRL